MGVFSIFQDPWLLAALALLPALFWLLRHQPPRARHVAFPATWVIARIRRRDETPRTTPWWLLLLRVMVMAFVITGLARPFLAGDQAVKDGGPLVLIIDNDWTAAADWDKRMRAAGRLIDAAQQRGAGIAVVATEPRIGEADRTPDFSLKTGDAASAALRLMAPQPWSPRRAAFLGALKAASLPPGADIQWLWDGVGGADTANVAAWLAARGRLNVLHPSAGNLPLYIRAVEERRDSLAVTLGRMEAGAAMPATLRLTDAAGSVVARQTADFAAGQARATLTLRLPPETFNRLERAEIAGSASAAATYLFGEDWRRRRVGLVAAARNSGTPSLTSPEYYIERALEPITPLTVGTLDDILDDSDAIVLPDRPLSREDIARLTKWIGGGGLLLRFAGDNLVAQPDSLAPMNIRPGGRQLGATMTWDKPMPLGAFDSKSPFAGLAVPQDVRVTRQVLADPNALAGAEIWARLADDTPLVTARHIGDGLLVMFQVGADPTYSTLPYSGLFVDMLQTVIKLSGRKAAAPADAGGSLAPERIMNGHGILDAAPPGLDAVAPADWQASAPTPRHPPGFYAGPQGGRALNLAGQKALATLGADMNWPAGTTLQTLDGVGGINLLPPFLLVALLLAMLDIAVSFLRGFRPRRAVPAAAALVLLLFLPGHGHAQDAAAPPLSPEQFAIMAAGQTHLAYVATPDPDADKLTDAGLKTLSQMLTQRTSVEPAAPIALNLETEDISFFPVIYWAIEHPYPRLSAAVIKKLGLYMETGGLLVVDTGDGSPLRLGVGSTLPGETGTDSLSGFIGQFATEPMAPLASDHVLGRSFYLLRDFPGRWAGQKLWVSARSNQDTVSPIIVTSNGWAAGWALAANGDPMVPIIPGGRTQQEMAWRTGVNLMMYALSGTYKSDQVHVPALLERLGQ